MLEEKYGNEQHLLSTCTTGRDVQFHECADKRDGMEGICDPDHWKAQIKEYVSEWKEKKWVRRKDQGLKSLTGVDGRLCDEE